MNDKYNINWSAGLKKFSELKGQIITRIVVSEDEDTIVFYLDNGKAYIMFHDRNCSEDVFIDDISGNLDNLLNRPIMIAEEVISCDNDKEVKVSDDTWILPPGPKDEYDDSYTWTFYKLATSKGYVTIRWYGTSNGYYSEDVDFYELENTIIEIN